MDRLARGAWLLAAATLLALTLWFQRPINTALGISPDAAIQGFGFAGGALALVTALFYGARLINRYLLDGRRDASFFIFAGATAVALSTFARFDWFFLVRTAETRGWTELATWAA